MSQWETQQPLENAMLKKEKDKMQKKYDDLLVHHAGLIESMINYDTMVTSALYRSSLYDKNLSFRDDLDSKLNLTLPTCLK